MAGKVVKGESAKQKSASPSLPVTAAAAAAAAKIANFANDFILSRCTASKFSEDMTPQRAATLLKMPLNKSNNNCIIVARKELDECFIRALHNRFAVNERDKNYEEKLQQRHVYEGEECVTLRCKLLACPARHSLCSACTGSCTLKVHGKFAKKSTTRHENQA
jgi:hypothetical protein